MKITILRISIPLKTSRDGINLVLFHCMLASMEIPQLLLLLLSKKSKPGWLKRLSVSTALTGTWSWLDPRMKISPFLMVVIISAFSCRPRKKRFDMPRKNFKEKNENKINRGIEKFLPLFQRFRRVHYIFQN